MIKRIHVDPKLEKSLTELRKGDRRTGLVAERVAAIIAKAKCGNLPPKEIITFTRNGEARIRGCRKYDLGGGYRLVTLKQGTDLYLLFVGTHDECDRWVENNREHLPLEMIAERCRTVNRSVPKITTPENLPSIRDVENEEDSVPPLTDHDLRMVFRGLVGGK